jgi:hypothetical protein
MNQIDRFVLIVALCLAFILGAIFDRGYLDSLQFSKDVDFVGLVGVVITLAIAIMIPFFVQRLIEDTRGIKSFLIDEMKELIGIVRQVQEAVNLSYKGGQFSADNKREILRIFHDAEVKVGSIQDQLSVAYNSRSKDMAKAIKKLLFRYKSKMTGGVLMNVQFTAITDTFYRDSRFAYSEIDTGLKTLVQKMYKF